MEGALTVGVRLVAVLVRGLAPVGECILQVCYGRRYFSNFPTTDLLGVWQCNALHLYLQIGYGGIMTTGSLFAPGNKTEECHAR